MLRKMKYIFSTNYNNKNMSQHQKVKKRLAINGTSVVVVAVVFVVVVKEG